MTWKTRNNSTYFLYKGDLPDMSDKNIMTLNQKKKYNKNEQKEVFIINKLTVFASYDTATKYFNQQDNNTFLLMAGWSI